MHRLLCGIDAASRLVMPSCSGAHVCVPHAHEKFNGLFESAISLDVEKALAKHVAKFTLQNGKSRMAVMAFRHISAYHDQAPPTWGRELYPPGRPSSR